MAEAPTRRSFLSGALGAVAGALAAVPVLGALLSPLLKPRPREASAFLPAANVNDLVVGYPKQVDLVASSRDAWSLQESSVVGSAWLVKRDNGSVVAFSTVCPHLGCPVRYQVGKGFTCPCHDSLFRLDGERVAGPSARGLDALDVQARSGKVLVRPARFKGGTPDKREL